MASLVFGFSMKFLMANTLIHGLICFYETETSVWTFGLTPNVTPSGSGPIPPLNNGVVEFSDIFICDPHAMKLIYFPGSLAKHSRAAKVNAGAVFLPSGSRIILAGL
ncbi:MAG: hypothetical protein CM1200mP3_09140 [Chloroflexota bacterium]|nr:MAG: hypothetical protein CM1200mP3_09140 [Chloroflexota bacterium]